MGEAQVTGGPAKEQNRAIAVSTSEFHEFGCPCCGGIFGRSPISGGDTMLWECADFGTSALIVADGLSRSSIGVGGGANSEAYYPEVVDHPRRGQPVDREKLIADREAGIERGELTRLKSALDLGYGVETMPHIEAHHRSKSQELPIVSAQVEGSPVEVTWFAQNYHFYFMGVKLQNEVPATLLSPLAGILESDPALSGHVNTEVAPPIPNFQKSYHNNEPLTRFGIDCGGRGFLASTAIRYLAEISKVDAGQVLDLCLNKTRYGRMERIDGNAIEFEELLKALQLEYSEASYNANIIGFPEEVFESIAIDRFDTERGGSSVRIKLHDGFPLPVLAVPGEIYVKVEDTGLEPHIPKDSGERGSSQSKSKIITPEIPVSVLRYSDQFSRVAAQVQEGIPYPINAAYQRVWPSAREFTFNTPNVLDAALTAFYFAKVVGPLLRDSKRMAAEA